jgi:hypothetical protein
MRRASRASIILVSGMGVHYVNGGLLVIPRSGPAPEALVYEPQANGRLRSSRSSTSCSGGLGGRREHGAQPCSANSSSWWESEPLWPAAVLQLHAWIWKHNPRGTFDDWNRGELLRGPAADPDE